MEPDQAAESIVLTERDIQVMKYLNEHKFMTAGQIYDMFWPDSKDSAGAGRHRLVKLETSGYVRKIYGTAKTPMLFLVTKKAIDVLKEKGWDFDLREVKEIDENTVEHNLKLFNIRKVFERLGVCDWQTERVFRSLETTRGWYPDAVFRLKKYLFAVELENTFRSKPIYEQKFKWYEKAPEFRAVFYVLNWPFVKSWLMDFESTLAKIGFVIYDDLIKSGSKAVIENKTGKMTLGILFDE